MVHATIGLDWIGCHFYEISRHSPCHQIAISFVYACVINETLELKMNSLAIFFSVNALLLSQ